MDDWKTIAQLPPEQEQGAPDWKSVASAPPEDKSTELQYDNSNWQATAAAPPATVSSPKDSAPSGTNDESLTYRPGQYWEGIKNKIVDGISSILPSKPQRMIAAQEEFQKSDKSAWDYLKYGMAQSAGAGQDLQESHPANIALKPVGIALGAAQEYLGHPAAVMGLKAQLSGALPGGHPNDEYGQRMDSMTAAQKGEFGFLGNKGEGERFDGASLAEDRPPLKYHDASSKEVLVRRFLSALGGDKMKLSDSQEAVGLANTGLPDVKLPLVGDVSLSKGAAKLAEMGGELPFYIVGEEFMGVGKRVAATEKATLADGALLAPKELVKKTAAGEAHAAAMSFGASSAVVAAKNKEDVVSAAAEGYVSGQILHRLGGLLTGNSGVKKELLESVNTARKVQSGAVGAIVPPITWKQYLAEAAQVSERSKVKVRPGAALDKAPITISNSKVSQDWTPFTFKTVARDADGNLVEQRFLSNAKRGDTKLVYQTPITPSVKRSFKWGDYEITDRNAWADLMDELIPAKSSGNNTFAKAEFSAPERLEEIYKAHGLDKADFDTMRSRKPAEPTPGIMHEGPDAKLSNSQPTDIQYGEPKHIGESMIERPKMVGAPDELASEMQLNPTRATPNREAARVMIVDPKSGNVKAMPIVDRKPRTATLEVPRVEAGDVVHTPDGQPAIVESVRDDVVTANIKGKKVELSQADVVHADEDLVKLKDLYLPGQKGKNVYSFDDTAPRHSAEPTKQQSLLKFKKLDIKRVMNILEINNPAEAGQMLLDMHKAGQIEATHVPGEFRVAKSHQPSLVEWKNKEANKLVYYDTSDNGMGKSGVLRGRDPKNSNNVIVEVGDSVTYGPATLAKSTKAAGLGVEDHELFDKTRKISVPAEQVRPFFVGDAKKSTIPAMHGIGRPMPSDAIVTSEAAARAIAKHSSQAGALSKITGLNKDDIKKGLMRYITHDAWLVPTELRAVATRLANQPGIVKAKSEMYQTALANRVGGELSPLDRTLANIAQMRATKGGASISPQAKALKDFFAAHPELDAEVQKTVTTALTRLKANQGEMAKLGITNIANQEAMRAIGAEDEYTMNVYLKYLMQRKDFAKFVKEQLPSEWEKAVAHITRQYKGEYAWQTEAKMLDVLGLDVETAYKESRVNPSGQVAAKLRERIAMSEEIQKVLGKLDSASVQVAHGLAASDSIISRVRDWNTIQQTPYWSPGPRPDLGPHNGIQVPNTPLYGSAAGGWMHESFRFLLEAKPPHVEGMQAMRTLNAAWKFNQVVGGGFAPWVNQVMRNWKGAVISGGLQSPADFATFFDAADMMLKFSNNPILGKGTVFEEAMNNGANTTGFAGNEIMKHKAANRIMDAIKKQRGQSGDMWEMLAALPQHIKGTAQDVGAMYDAIDRLFKLTSYMNIRRGALSRGMSLDDAAALATMRVNQSFPNFEMVAPIIEKMRGGGISGIAPFLSSKAEDMRINATLLMRMKEEPDLIARVMGAGAVVGSMAGLMREQRKANGISDDMVRQGLDANPLAVQAYRPMAMVWPQLDGQKRMQLADLTQWEDAFIMMQHHENDFLPAAMMRNTITGYFGEETLGGQVTNQLMSNAVGVVPLSPMPNTKFRPGENGPLEALAFIAQSGGVPQGMLKAYHQYTLTQPPDTVRNSIQREQWTPEQAAAKFWGLPFAGPIGNMTEIARAKELQANEMDMQNQVRSVIMNQPRDKWQELIKAKTDQMIKTAGEYNDSKE